MKAVMKRTWFALAMPVLLMPATASLAHSLPDYLRPVGNLGSPYNLLIPNYMESPSMSAWEGFNFKPIISYNTIVFDHTRLRNAKGLTVGVSGGYDFRYDHFILGPTASVSYNFGRGDQSSIGGVAGYKAYADVDGSIGTRVGYIWDRTLIYATGGYALANTHVKNDSLGLSESKALSGWMAGGGLEYVWSDKSSVRLEYKRVQFSETAFDALPANNNRVKASMDIISIGFVRRF